MPVVEETNKAIARRYFDEILNQGKFEAIDELMAPNFLFTNNSYPEPIRGPEAFKQQLVGMMHSALPDWHFTVKELVAQGDTVVGHWTSGGTHTGGPIYVVGGPIQADGKHFNIEGMSWLRIVNGKIVESLVNEDDYGLISQLGGLSPQKTSPQSTATNGTEGNTNPAIRYFNEVMNQGKLEVIDEIVNPDFALHIPTIPEPLRGPQGLKQFAIRVRNGLPDVHFTVERQIVEENKIVVHWSLTGTHQGEFLGVQPTGRKVKDDGTDIFHLTDGKITELWIVENDLALLQQLGAISI